MEEEKKELDMKGVAEDVAEAERVAEEARKEPEAGSYTHTFKKPFPWKGKTYETLTFDWASLDGGDHLEIESEIVMKGRTLVSPAFTGDFLAGMAAREAFPQRRTRNAEKKWNDVKPTRYRD